MLNGQLRINCPCCGAALNAEVRVGNVLEATKESGEVNGVNEITRQKKLKEQALMEQGNGILLAAKELGVFEPFNVALEATMKSVPINRDLYFIKWMTRATKKNINQFSLRQAMPDGVIGRLEAWGCDNLTAILSDGEFKIFAPTDLIYGRPIERLEVTKDGIKPIETLTWDIWIKTKFGYVEKGSEFAEEMRKYRVGNFSV